MPSPPPPPSQFRLTTTAAGAAPALATMAATAPPPRLVLFTATPDSATGVPWCLDCARSLKGVRSAAASLGAALVEVEVARAEWKAPPGAPPCPLRAEYGLAGIPSLGLVGEGGALTALLGRELEGAAGDAAADGLVTAWVGEKGQAGV